MHAAGNLWAIWLVALSVWFATAHCCAEETAETIQEQGLSRLIGTLRSRDVKEVTAAVLEIARRGEDAEAAVPWLLESLSDEREVYTRKSVADLATYALAQIGAPAIAPLGKLIAEVKDPEIRDRAFDAISQMEGPGQPALDVLLKVGYDPDSDIRARIVQMVTHIAAEMDPPSPVALDFLIEGMHHEQGGTRFQATRALFHVAPDPVLFLDEFVQRLHDSDVDVRVMTLRELGKIGPDVARCVPEVVRLLDDRTKFAQRMGPIGLVAGEACKTLAEMGDAVKGALPKVRPLLDHEDAYVRCDAALACVVLSEDQDEALHVLIISADSKMYHLGVAYHAMQALARIGPPAAEGMFMVKRALLHDDNRMRTYAVRAACRIDPTEARPLLLDMADDSDFIVRGAVVQAMEKYSPEDPEVLQVVVDGLTDTGSLVGHYSLVCLKQWGDKAAPAIPVLKRLLKENPTHYQAGNWKNLLRDLEAAQKSSEAEKLEVN